MLCRKRICRRLSNGRRMQRRAPGVNLYIVKLSYESNVIDGLRWARSKGCRVVSFSGWTYKKFDREEYNAIQEAYTAATSALLCASGGNTGKKEYHYPASHTNTLCVGAATYSAGQNQYVVIPRGTYNDRMDLVAPGGHDQRRRACRCRDDRFAFPGKTVHDCQGAPQHFKEYGA